MKNISKNFLWAISALILTALLFSFIIDSATEPEAFSLSDLADRINMGDVESIVVSGHNLDITLTDGNKAEAKKEFEASLTDTLSNYGVSAARLKDVSIEVEEPSGGRFWAGILIPSLLPLIILVFFFWFLFRSARGGANQVMSFGRSNVKAVTGQKDRITFKDVAGLKEEKQELSEIVEFLKTPQKFLRMGAKIPRGVLLMGAPGSGKTLLARAVSGESGVPFFHISASEFVEMFVGVGAARIRDTFQTAKRAAPAILFIDEIDAVGRQRGAGLGGGHDEREQTLNQILVEMDGFERDSKVIVLAATNRPDILDQALLRPGRFDRRVVIDLPDIAEREAILKLHAQNKPVEKSIDFRRIAVRTPGFSGADLENLLNEAAILSARKDKKIITQLEIFDAIEKVLLGPEKRDRVISDKEKEITAYHEAGHALVAASLKDADPVHKISIISRGHAGGYTLKLPIEERRLKSKKQFLADLAILMGGYVAEQVTFKDITTGASNDLEKATELSRQLVTKFGMSEGLGPVSLGSSQGSIFLGRDMMGEKNYSDHTAMEIDREVSTFLDRAYQLAKKILLSRKKALEKIAKTLIEKETIEQEEFDILIKSFKLKPLAI
ncbi:MAG: ATP-dependent zinc metalloprotease FtsH [Candidatus Harrisonbacteria bacterium]|nr:ATP-dependent zinc metalloprotease FtsH [Candidatus Harrisonbacteria bacterium]